MYPSVSVAVLDGPHKGLAGVIVGYCDCETFLVEVAGLATPLKILRKHLRATSAMT